MAASNFDAFIARVDHSSHLHQVLDDVKAAYNYDMSVKVQALAVASLYLWATRVDAMLCDDFTGTRATKQQSICCNGEAMQQ